MEEICVAILGSLLKDKFLVKNESTQKLIQINTNQENKNDDEIEYNLDEDAPENSFLKKPKD